MPLQEPVTEPLKSNNLFSQISYYIKPMALPLLLAVFPTFYHYSNNVDKLTLASLYRMIVFNAIVVVVVYVVCALCTRFQPFRAALAASMFLIFFNVYGLLYRYLIRLDVIRIKHYTLLPLILLLAIYAMFLLTRWKEPVLLKLWNNLLLIIGILVFFNAIRIVPGELRKWNSNTATGSLAMQQVAADKSSPDIYYIILDEFEGLQGMREYWHYQGVDEFANFLKDKGFFVAENSHGSSIDTLHQMASRLNYREYPLDPQHVQTYFDDIADNRVVRFLKSRGYNIVAFDETKLGYASAKPMKADYLYEYGSSSISQENGGTFAYGFYFDEFGELVMDNTMLYVMSQKYKSNNPMVTQHSDMVFFTVNNIASKDVPSPKFVHVHLLLPHTPFMFDENGKIVDNNLFFNWNHYIDTYKFTIKVTERMVENILQASDPNNPPVIILQSDHGARNLEGHGENVVNLQNYPEDLKTLILFALYMPGYDYSTLPQDVKPINTFPIVFNYLFDEHIALLK